MFLSPDKSQKTENKDKNQTTEYIIMLANQKMQVQAKPIKTDAANIVKKIKMKA